MPNSCFVLNFSQDEHLDMTASHSDKLVSGEHRLPHSFTAPTSAVSRWNAAAISARV